jgi:hypothetical protein
MLVYWSVDLRLVLVSYGAGYVEVNSDIFFVQIYCFLRV